MSVSGITKTNQYLTFRLDQEIYALEINQVREVVDMTGITRVPKMPDFMRGVINLRGRVVPVLDLRLKFGIGKTEKNINTCIIIIEIIIEGEMTLLGALADSVKEVMTLEPDQIEPPPRIGTRLKTEFMKGIGKKDDDFIIILDIEKVFSLDELLHVQTIEKEVQ
ncbi:MAG: chemotaxis protein CheW [Desulfobacterales bacterium]|nr:chemotaxis protein CheW [Desulfobacterales bacterium]MBF0395381.1 chemotaxis protein CheW [Desulfobacterales bacterium]